MKNQSAIIEGLDKPFLVMGIVNVTPDSFFDGGKHSTIDSAVEHALRLCDEGADILDIGGASSRPGAAIVSPEEEIKRLVPVIEKIKKSFFGPISVDTTWVKVAEATFNVGATWINDISSGRFDPDMPNFVARKKCPVILMHSRKTPDIMQQNPNYNDVIKEVVSELLYAVNIFIKAGSVREQIILDPGIGFAKTAEHNVILLNRLHDLIKEGYPVLIGTSRKNFVGKITGKEVQDRLYGSLATIASSYVRGAKIFRVHDVKETRDFLKVLSVIENLLPINYFNA